MQCALYIVYILFGLGGKASANLKCKSAASDDFNRCVNPFTVHSNRQDSDIGNIYKKTEDEAKRKEWYEGFCTRKFKKERSVNEIGPIGKKGNGPKRECHTRLERMVCDKSYFSTLVDLMPFTYQIMQSIQGMLKGCCHGCASVCPKDTVESLTKISEESIAASDIVFPIIAKQSAHSLHGFYFLPILNVPNSYLITKRPSKKAQTARLVHACGHLWPLLTICLLFAIISGFIAWLMEFSKNEDEFPKEFLNGMFEGFWWAFVSMTTVGYGDRTPKSIGCRIFAIGWILTGITICSMFTASLTSEITKSMAPNTPTIRGMNIGALRHRLHDAILISTYGGIIVDVGYKNVNDGINKLIRLLDNETISGFVVDIQTYYYYKTVRQDGNDESELPISEENLIVTEKHYNGDALSFGMLFKNKTSLDYFESYFVQNQLQLETCYNLQMNAKMQAFPREEYLLDPEGGLFFMLLYYLFGAISLIMIVGGIYEYMRYLKKQKVNAQGNDCTLGI